VASRFTVRAGEHPRRCAPITVTLPDLPNGDLTVRNIATGHRTAAQRGLTGLVFLLDDLAAGAEARFEVESGPGDGLGVQVIEHENELEFTIDGDLFTRYRYGGEGLARPYFWPVVGPDRRQVTRAFPMVADAPGEVHDHPHHRSIWVAYGELDGYDAWAEGTNHGSTLHVGFDEIISGPVFGGFREQTQWVDAVGNGLIKEERDVRVYRTPDGLRLMDVDLHWTFGRLNGRGRKFGLGQVHLGDTKEAGLIAVRVATSMDAKGDGTIENAWGGTNEAETWGKRAPWCDYSGPVDGETVGIAAFDHPSNLHFPCYWHVRNYGLMGANPWSGEAFTDNPMENGATTYRFGDELRFRYRLYIHPGDAGSAHVGDHWFNFGFPPEVKVEG
jgi:hypothetical protein